MSSPVNVRKEIVGKATECLSVPFVQAPFTWHIWGCLLVLWPDAPAGVVGTALHFLVSSGHSDNRGAVHDVWSLVLSSLFASTGPKLTLRKS